MKNAIHLTSERLILRPILPSDNQALLAYRSDAITNRFQGWIPTNLEEVNQFIATIPPSINLTNTWYQLAIVTKSDSVLIGDLGIFFKDDYQCEVGCTLAKGHHGKGYAVEALKTVIDYLFTDLKKHRIVTSIDPENLPSKKLVRRLGFRFEGCFKQSLMFKGQWVDDEIYAMLNTEWKPDNH